MKRVEGRDRRRAGHVRAGAARRRALHRPCREKRDPDRHAQQRADAGQHLEGDGGIEPRAARESESAARLLHDPRADLRPHQHGQCEGRQFRASGRHLADGDDHADGAGLCQLHGAAEKSSRHPQGDRRGNRDRGSGHSRRGQARQRPGHHDREHRRYGDRHGHDPRDDAEQGRIAVARHARHRRHDAADRRGRRGAFDRGAGQPDRQLRLHRQGWRGEGSERSGRAAGRP